MVSNIFGIFFPKIGEDDPISLIFFQMHWFNHQLDETCGTKTNNYGWRWLWVDDDEKELFFLCVWILYPTALRNWNLCLHGNPGNFSAIHGGKYIPVGWEHIWDILMTREMSNFVVSKAIPTDHSSMIITSVPTRLFPRKASYKWSYCTLINGLKLSGFHQGYNPACGSCTPIHYLVQSLVVPKRTLWV